MSAWIVNLFFQEINKVFCPQAILLGFWNLNWFLLLCKQNRDNLSPLWASQWGNVKSCLLLTRDQVEKGKFLAMKILLCEDWQISTKEKMVFSRAGTWIGLMSLSDCSRQNPDPQSSSLPVLQWGEGKGRPAFAHLLCWGEGLLLTTLGEDCF